MYLQRFAREEIDGQGRGDYSVACLASAAGCAGTAAGFLSLGAFPSSWSAELSVVGSAAAGVISFLAASGPSAAFVRIYERIIVAFSTS